MRRCCKLFLDSMGPGRTGRGSEIMRAVALILFGATCLVNSLGCVASHGEVGVSNQWRLDLERFENGVSTQDEVLRALGPPSQLIPLKDQVVFYYMLERHDGRDFYLILYNRRSDSVYYDRAIFFFDDEGILSHHAYSDREIPYKPTKPTKAEDP
jgi:hypothetical protein